MYLDEREALASTDALAIHSQNERASLELVQSFYRLRSVDTRRAAGAGLRGAWVLARDLAQREGEVLVLGFRLNEDPGARMAASLSPRF